MTLYIGREASKLWKRMCAETTTEINLLADNWKYILTGLILQLDAYALTSVSYVSCPQYIHGLAARGVHYLHRPGPTLQDVGFFLLPIIQELGEDKAYISETVFTFAFLSFVMGCHYCDVENCSAVIDGEVVLNPEVPILHGYIHHQSAFVDFDAEHVSYSLILNWDYVLLQWTFHPFIFKSKKIYTVLVWCRVLAFLVGSKLARLPHPESVFEVLLINFPRGITHGCGDLIFSSHMIFTLVFVRTYQKYGTKRCIKQLGWLIAVVQSFLIIASRKHYTVDVTVAWYTVNLVVFFLDKKLPELPDRTGGASFLLPLSTKDKDSKTKEENHKLLNGNSVDPADWRQRTQVNGKTLDDANLVHADATAMNGA
ncbi:hypothetical protein SADUNF_Sadunf16G0090700 [Salix dunnii]|uniref:Sphingomyelin synthase-like domain-containing protein n=1 Tax=Salix dunnii TaxID=1413687 RepID=A0A835MLA4_9ROSI|nr:hypothetical protein SADUNF_Sadunf16G0090700 [Salix dunnii]